MQANRARGHDGIRDSKILNRASLQKGLIKYAQDFIAKR